MRMLVENKCDSSNNWWRERLTFAKFKRQLHPWKFQIKSEIAIKWVVTADWNTTLVWLAIRRTANATIISLAIQTNETIFPLYQPDHMTIYCYGWYCPLMHLWSKTKLRRTFFIKQVSTTWGDPALNNTRGWAEVDPRLFTKQNESKKVRQRTQRVCDDPRYSSIQTALVRPATGS